MDRYWFFTWRTYGTWLPGADGFVGYYRNPDRVIENAPGQPTTEAIPPLERYAREVMSGEPVLLSVAQAEILLRQFHETAAYRGWVIDAVAVMSNHVHIVFGVPGDPDPSEMLKTWKSYASRALNRGAAKPNAPRWFADGGSKRPLKAEANRIGAICYVRDQEGPLLVWLGAEAAELANRQRQLPGEADCTTRTLGNTQATDVAGSPGARP
jgi:REP element-mobilizing transposase RayT